MFPGRPFDNTSNNIISSLIVSIHSAWGMGGGRGGWTSYQIFKKRGGGFLRISIFRGEGIAGKEEGFAVFT